MTDNKTIPLTGAGDSTATPATKEVTFSGDTTDVQLIEIVAVTGAEGSRALNEISDASGIRVQGVSLEDGAATGNPIPFGGRYDLTPRALDDGDRGETALDLTGAIIIATNSSVLNHTFDLDSSAYSDGDVLATAQQLDGVVRTASGTGIIRSITIIDTDDQAQAMDVVVSDQTITLGTKNSAVSISDTDASTILGIIEVAAGDYVDLINSQIARPSFDPFVIQPFTGRDIYISAVSRGTGTYTASGVSIRFGILQD